MSGNSEEKKTYYRLAPCPAYDVEGMESWLEDLAEEGLFLTEDGFFCGFGFFHKEEPKKLKYRLQASEVPGGFLSDGDEPEKEQREISEALGWEFVSRRGEFYIYRSVRDDVREFNTDPEIQAITMKMVQKRQFSSIISCLIWFVLYPLVKKNGAFLVPILYMKTWFYLFSIVLGLFLVLSPAWKFIYYTRLQRKLKRGEQLNREKDWKKKAWLHPARNLVLIIAGGVWLCLVLANIHRTVLFEDEVPLAEYTGNPPFATMADIAPGKSYELRDMGYFNTVVEWSDVIAPVNFIWEEITEVQITEDRRVYGLWDVNYHELRWEWMAKLLAKDYIRMDRERNFKMIGELELGVDDAVAYVDNIHMEKIVLRHGKKVMQATFHEYAGGQEAYFSLEEWAKLMAESIK